MPKRPTYTPAMPPENYDKLTPSHNKGNFVFDEKAKHPKSVKPATTPAGMEYIVKTGEWIATLILTLVPLVNIICLFMWAFASGTRTSKKYYARAVLLLAMVSIIIIVVVLLILIFAFGINLASLLS
jgi:small-conductance mechanosensitive channel